MAGGSTIHNDINNNQHSVVIENIYISMRESVFKVNKYVYLSVFKCFVNECALLVSGPNLFLF